MAGLIRVVGSALARIMARGSVSERAEEDRSLRLAVVPFTLDVDERGASSSPPSDVDEEGRCFCEGLAHEITRLLGGLDRLDVVAATSSGRHPGASPTPIDLRAQLGVDFALEGVCRRSPERLSLVARLTDLASARVVWSGGRAGVPRDVFAIVHEVDVGVSTALGCARIGRTDDLIHHEPTPDVGSYDDYLIGRCHLARATDDGLMESIRRFERAVRRDPAFALGWAALAEAYVSARRGLPSLPPREAAKRAGEAAGEALVLDATIAGANASMAHLSLAEWDWAGTDAALERATELAPSNPTVARVRARRAMHCGELERAIVLYDRAVALDPRSDEARVESSWPYLLLGRFEEAIERCREVVHRDPEFGLAYFTLGIVAERRGRPSEAITYYRAAVELSAREPHVTAFLGMALVSAGDREEAEAIADDLARKAVRGTEVAACLGALMIRLARTERGLKWLERGVDAKETMALMLDTHFLPLPEVRSHARFVSLLERVPRPSVIGMRP